MLKERVKSEDGKRDIIILRQKRVLKVLTKIILTTHIFYYIKVPCLELLKTAKSEINWPFGLRSLMSLRPNWVLLPSTRYMISCLCEKCHNLTLEIRFWSARVGSTNFLTALILRALKTFFERARHGTALEKLAVMEIPNFTSQSSLVDLLLHPCVSPEMKH